MNTLLINGHERFGPAEGKLNYTFIKTAEKTLGEIGHQVNTLSVDSEYNPEEVVQQIFWADAVIYQTPVYWFNVPGKFKKFIDTVFNTGLMRFLSSDGRNKGEEYGATGVLTNKKYMLSTTWNAPEYIFNSDSAFLMKDKSVDDVFLSFHLSNRYIGMQQLPTFGTFDIYRQPTIEEDLEKFKSHLHKYLS